MKAYVAGYVDGSTGAKQKQGRAYETDKANKAYFKGFADGLRARHPGQPIVKCNRDATIFPAYIHNDSISCPTCARRYIKNEKGDYESDRLLVFL